MGLVLLAEDIFFFNIEEQSVDAGSCITSELASQSMNMFLGESNYIIFAL